MADSTTAPGGFRVPSLPSPAPSNVSHSSTASSLPHPRSQPLRAGSAKEDAARRYIESRLLHISRRYTKKFQPSRSGEDVHGYESMVDVSRELGELVDVLWLSGTPSLQIPYLLNISLSVTTYLRAFPPAPKTTFRLLRKLDHAFASLLTGEDTLTGEILPGFEGGKRAMSGTDMVRCKSIVESTRVAVVEIMSKEGELDEGDGADESAAEMDDEVDVDVESCWDDDEDRHNMAIARVYEETIVQLGEQLEGKVGNNTGSGQS